jgi:hypothetical protein
MIERLACFLSEEQGCRKVRSYAEMIIAFLESQGMQPPRRVKFAPTAYAEPNKRVVYEWEPESEE